MNPGAPETLDAHLYRDPAVYEAERRAVFARSWLLLAHESQLAAPGAYMAATVAGYPVFAVRGENGAIHAFHNVCRHRAGPLVGDGSGACDGALVCRYHGWRYALDGRLASPRDFGPARDFDPRQYHLLALRCETWRGFVFVNANEEAAPLAHALGALDARARDTPLEAFRFAFSRTHDIRCNWKIYVENYLEGYHVGLVHPALDAQIDSARYEVEVEAPVVFHRAPAKDGAPVAGLWAWVWPALGVNLYPDGVMLERMWPLAHNRTRLDYLYFFADPGNRARVEKALALSEDTTAEDIAICEAVQGNLDAGVYTKGRLSPKHEAGVAWFQARLTEVLGG